MEENCKDITSKCFLSDKEYHENVSLKELSFLAKSLQDILQDILTATNRITYVSSVLTLENEQPDLFKDCKNLDEKIIKYKETIIFK